MAKTTIIMGMAIPGDMKIIDKEKKKIEMHQNLKREIQRLWKLEKIVVVYLVLGALRIVIKNFEKYVDKIGIEQIYILHKNYVIRDSSNIEKSAIMLTKGQE